MKIRLHELKIAIENIEKTFVCDENSSVVITIQEDDPGEGKICSIVKLHVENIHKNMFLDIEIFDRNENRPVSAVLVKELTKPKLVE
jgi:hypothetical protein